LKNLEIIFEKKDKKFEESIILKKDLIKLLTEKEKKVFFKDKKDFLEKNEKKKNKFKHDLFKSIENYFYKNKDEEVLN
jgi:hypothetical protein